MVNSGVDSVGKLISALGLTQLAATPESDGLTDLCASLMSDLGAAPTVPKLVTRDEQWSLLSPRAEEAQAVFGIAAKAAEIHGPKSGPMVWADPSMTLLAPFWLRVLGLSVTVVHVHRHPGSLAADLVAGGLDETTALEAWDQINRAALALWEERAGLVIGLEAVEDDPDGAIDDVVALLASVGVHPTKEQRATARVAVELVPRLPRLAGVTVANRFEVLNRVLTISGRTEAIDADAVVGALAGYYDQDYFEHYGSDDGAPYRPGIPEWEEFFNSIAWHIVDSLHPATTLDAGCAVGFLVVALHDRGVEAHGVDISPWAISQVPERVRSRVRMMSLTDELDGHYDLITCVEVIEHLPDAVADRVVGNLTRHAEAVLFSSTSDGFEEATHINVRPPAHWARLFAEHGFVRDPAYDASYLSAEAVLFVPGDSDSAAVLARYEEALWRSTSRFVGQLSDSSNESSNRSERIAALEVELAAEAKESARLRASLSDQDRTHNSVLLGLQRDILDARRLAEDRATDLKNNEAELDGIQARLAAVRRTVPMRLSAVIGRALRRAPETS
jgi:hypothetical protein